MASEPVTVNMSAAAAAAAAGNTAAAAAAAAGADAVRIAEIITEARNLENASGRYVRAATHEMRKARLDKVAEAARLALMKNRPYPRVEENADVGSDAPYVASYPLRTAFSRTSNERVDQSDKPDNNVYRRVAKDASGRAMFEVVEDRRRYSYRWPDVACMLLGPLPPSDVFLQDKMDEFEGPAYARTQMLSLVGNALMLHISRGAAGQSTPLEFGLPSKEDPVGMLLDLEAIMRVAQDLCNDVSVKKIGVV